VQESAQNRTSPGSAEADRAELEMVVDALSRSPRLAHLLRHIGERYLQGDSASLNEYNIATEVFERPKTSFDASEDAIARVEAHRLRKRLKEYYDSDGRDHEIQVSLPPGTYVPVFTRRAAEGVSEPSTDPTQSSIHDAALIQPDVASTAEPHSSAQPIKGRFGPRKWLALAVVATTALAAYAVSTYLNRTSEAAQTEEAASADSKPASIPVVAGKANVPLRIIAGYTGIPQLDSAGDHWETDQYFSNGGVWKRNESRTERTRNPLLFQQWRTGDFFYDIPLAPGTYELHLYFVSTENATQNASTFSVAINRKRVLEGFDINSDALGENIADERVFRDVSPDKDGLLHLGFTSEEGVPMLNALEILPGIPHAQLPIRIVTQVTSVTDHLGRKWLPDNYFMNGRLSVQHQQIQGTDDPELYAYERYGHFTYAIPVDTRDRYTLILHFAEMYFGPNASGSGGAGNRVFRVFCNGETLLDNFDIFKEAGTQHALTKSFQHIKPSPQGKINLTFEPILNNATVSGIEVIDESH